MTEGTPTASSKALDYARKLAGEAINAPGPYLDVIALSCAITHKIDDLYSAPRIIVLGEKGTGKSTVLTVASYLAGGTNYVTGIKAITAPSYVASYRANSCWTPLLDEVNHLFGDAGADAKTTQLRTYLNQGYKRDTAWAGHVESKVTINIPIFGVVFMAGQGKACPEDMHDRSIVLNVKAVAEGISTADFSDERIRAKFQYGALVLESWAKSLPKLSVADVRELNLHPKLTKRNMEVWGGLFAMALQAGDVWLKKCLTAFEQIECDQADIIHTPEVQLLLDYAEFAASRATATSGDDSELESEFSSLGIEVETESGTEGIASGEFMAFVMVQEHGAFAWMKKQQFQQFAVAQLGPTDKFWDADKKERVRGWSDVVHQMNLDRANQVIARMAEGEPVADSEPETYADF